MTHTSKDAIDKLLVRRPQDVLRRLRCTLERGVPGVLPPMFVFENLALTLPTANAPGFRKKIRSYLFAIAGQNEHVAQRVAADADDCVTDDAIDRLLRRKPRDVEARLWIVLERGVPGASPVLFQNDKYGPLLWVGGAPFSHPFPDAGLPNFTREVRDFVDAIAHAMQCDAQAIASAADEMAP